MNEEIEIKNLERERNTLLSTHQYVISPEMEHQRDDLLMFATKMAFTENHTVDVIDLNLKTVISHTSAYKHKFSNPVFIANDLDNQKRIKDLTHPDFYAKIFRFENEVLKHLLLLPAGQLAKFKVSYLRPMKVGKTKYCCFLHHITVAVTTDDGFPWQLLGVSEQFPVTSKTKAEFYHNFAIFPEDIALNNEFFLNKMHFKLSRREEQVLQELCDGTPKEVANDLFLSPKTIITYCSKFRGILKISSFLIVCQFYDRVRKFWIVLMLLDLMMDNYEWIMNLDLIC